MASFSDNFLAGQSQDGVLSDKIKAEGGIMPSTPAGALALGASPDSAKMMGTPAQKQASFGQSLMRDRAKMQTAQAEVKRIQEDKSKKKLGESAERLAPAAEFAAKFPKLAVQYALTSAAGNKQLLASSIDWEFFNGSTQHLGEAAKADLRLALETLKDAPDSATREAALARIASSWGTIPDSNTLSKFFRGATAQDTEDLRRIFAQGTEDFGEVTVGKILANLDPAKRKELTGVYSLEELTTLLRLEDPEDVAAMTFDEVKNRLREIGKDFDVIGELKQKVAATTTSDPERQAALRQLREYGIVGSIDPVEKLGDLGKQIEDGDKITFDGEEISVEEVLSDDWLIGRVSDALSDPLEMNRLRTFSPEFAEWVEANRMQLEQHVTGVLDSRGALIDTNSQVGKLNAIPDSEVAIPDSLMKAFIPGWGSTTFTQVPDLSNNQLYQMITTPGISDLARTNTINSLTWLQNTYPQRFTEMLKAPNFDEIDLMRRDPMEWQDDVQSFEDFQVEKNSWTSQEDILDALFGSNIWKTQLGQMAENLLYVESGGKEPTQAQIDAKVAQLKGQFSSSFMASGEKLNVNASPSDVRSDKKIGLSKQFSDALQDAALLKERLDKKRREEEEVAQKTKEEAERLEKIDKDIATEREEKKTGISAPPPPPSVKNDLPGNDNFLGDTVVNPVVAAVVDPVKTAVNTVNAVIPEYGKPDQTIDKTKPPRSVAEIEDEWERIQAAFKEANIPYTSLLDKPISKRTDAEIDIFLKYASDPVILRQAREEQLRRRNPAPTPTPTPTPAPTTAAPKEITPVNTSFANSPVITSAGGK
jgi:hypothetical protein